MLKQKLLDQKQIKAVMVHRDEIHERTGEKYTALAVAEGHPAMAYLEPSKLCLRLGLPIIMRRYPPTEGLGDEVEWLDNTNSGPNLLLICEDVRSQRWGLWPSEASVLGPVVVSRKDLKDLLPQHVEALFVYLMEVIKPAFEESVGFGEGVREKAAVLELITRERFELCFHKYREVMMDKDESWIGVRSPYLY